MIRRALFGFHTERSSDVRSHGMPEGSARVSQPPIDGHGELLCDKHPRLLRANEPAFTYMLAEHVAHGILAVHVPRLFGFCEVIKRRILYGCAQRSGLVDQVLRHIVPVRDGLHVPRRVQGLPVLVQHRVQ